MEGARPSSFTIDGVRTQDHWHSTWQEAVGVGEAA